MSLSSFLGLIELLLIFGLVLGLTLWEIRRTNAALREHEDESDDRPER
ncbi:MAG: hypothetical protein V2I43_20040 [Parvularcula sp.]|jgi:uncharacterized iron-regulated membrane protein|nr:hypothetical protein [Parvularcula sp.]